MVGGLEEPTSQLKLLNALTIEEQLAFLRSTLDTMDDDDTNHIDRLQMTMELYASGDELKFAKFIEDEFKRSDLSEKLREKIVHGLLIDRNQLMADAIVQNMRRSPDKVFFFAVGLGHLVGKDSVQDFLALKSVIVKRVANATELRREDAVQEPIR